MISPLAQATNPVRGSSQWPSLYDVLLQAFYHNPGRGPALAELGSFLLAASWATAWASSAWASADLFPASPGMELDLRGQRAEDALEALERYLDAAYLAGMPFVRIIHGKGTGRLREVVRQALGQNSKGRSYEAGGEKEGGDGVTVAKVAT